MCLLAGQTENEESPAVFSAHFFTIFFVIWLARNCGTERRLADFASGNWSLVRSRYLELKPLLIWNNLEGEIRHIFGQFLV